jgi:hypothetical protein
MTRGVCLISAGLSVESGLRELFESCGLAVSTPHTTEDALVYGRALCLVLDMPGDAPYRTLRLFREYGIATPALLVVDPGLEMAVSDLNCDGIMDILPRTASPLRILRWIQSLCAARNVLDHPQTWRLSA